MEKSASFVSETTELALPLSAEEVSKEWPTSMGSSKDDEMLGRIETIMERQIA